METVKLSVFHGLKARMMLRSLGGKVAAGYLRNRGYSFEECRYMLGLQFRG
jgi:hypothetical protein